MPVSKLLRSRGFRATPGRIRLLALLAKENKPRAVVEIQKKLGGKLNEVTLYRALEALAENGILERTELGHGHAHYELVAGKRHHHHMVCTVCGKIEDFSNTLFEAAVMKIKSNHFKKITNHSIELFGRCAKCA